MTVLRSCKVLTAVIPKTSNPVDNGIIEPVTPLKNPESNLLSSSITLSSSSPAPNSIGSKLGLRSGSSTAMETGSVRRRSVRLAGKIALSECVDTSNGKRKKVKCESSCANVEVGVRDMEMEVMDLDIQVDKSEEFRNPSMMEPENARKGNVNHSGKDELKVSESAAKLGLDSSGGLSEMENMGDRNEKRKLGKEIELLALVSGEKDEAEKGFLNLRSGKRVVKSKIVGDNDSAGSRCENLMTGKESEVMLPGDVSVKNVLHVNMEENENDGVREMTFSRADKGKGKAGLEAVVISSCDSADLEIDDKVISSLSNPESDAPPILTRSYSKEVAKDSGSVSIPSEPRRRLSREEKGKMKCGDNDSSSNYSMNPEIEVENANSSVPDSVEAVRNESLQDVVQVREADVSGGDVARNHRERYRRVARRIASRFAHFTSQDELGDHDPDISARENPLPEVGVEAEDWPGPFSTAMKIIKDRESNKNEGRYANTPLKSACPELKWIPVERQQCKHPKRFVPSLQDFCLSVLANNADSITSLDFIPDMLRHKICWFLCDCRRMNDYILQLLVHESPTEIRVRDCSWLSEELSLKTFKSCTTDKLTVLQLDQCGVCMPDYVLSATLARAPNSLPSLTTISLKGDYRLTDDGLRMLVSSAPNLKSVDLGQCSMLTSDGISYLANSLSLVLRELYVDNCDGIDALLILPALLTVENLNVLSVTGIHNASDDFVSTFVSVHGCRMKEIGLADCMELTDLALEVIGNGCSGLNALDLSNLRKLTDVSLCHLANGCQEIQTLKLCRNAFSDEAVAAYIDVRGSSLKQLSLNNITQVSNNTALSLARNCRNIQSLDLSWCRNLSNEALGLIADSCVSLETLRLFGCSQVTNVFLDGHSNQQVKLIGLKMTSVFQHISVPDFLQGPLRYSSTSS